MKKYTVYILLGALNVLHAFTHIIQFFQSVFLMSYSFKFTIWEEIMESPIVGVLLGILGLLSLYLGYRDYKHHKKHKD